MFCEIPDQQMGEIISAIVLPDAWVDRVLVQVHLADEVKRVTHERKKVEQRVRRLAQVYIDGHLPEEEYGRQRHSVLDHLPTISGVGAAVHPAVILAVDHTRVVWIVGDRVHAPTLGRVLDPADPRWPPPREREPTTR